MPGSCFDKSSLMGNFLSSLVSSLYQPPPSPLMSEKSLIEAFQRGDEYAFVSLYNRHKQGIYAFCCKMLLDKELAADVLQDTFIRVYENRDRLLSTSAFKSWLYTIARNQCLNHLARNKRSVPLDPNRHDKKAPITPIGGLEKAEQVELVNYLLAKLSDEYREAVILREYQNLSYEDIAAITRSSISSVKSRLFKARRKLAKLIDEMDAAHRDVEAVPINIVAGQKSKRLKK